MVTKEARVHRMKKQTFAAFFLLTMILGCRGEYVALFGDASGEPLRVFPYRVAAFPPADQQALRAGIPVANQEQLDKLLQDFFS